MGTPRPPAFRRRLAIAVPLALVGMLVLTSAASAGLLAPEAGGSKNADAIRTLYWLVFGLGVIIFVGVEGVLIYSLFKFRARKGAVAAQIHGNTRLEIGWTVGAAVILVVLAIFTFATLPDDPQPAELRRRRPPDRRHHERRRRRRPRAAPAERQVADDLRQRPAVHLALHVRATATTTPLNNVFSYEEMVVPADTTVTLDIQRPGRRALLVDPAARRQVRRRSRLHELHVVQDPGRQGGQHVPRAVRRAVRAQPREHDRARRGRHARRSSTSWLQRQEGPDQGRPTPPPRSSASRLDAGAEPVEASPLRRPWQQLTPTTVPSRALRPAPQITAHERRAASATRLDLAGSRRPITRRSGSCTWSRPSSSSCWAGSRRC